MIILFNYYPPGERQMFFERERQIFLASKASRVHSDAEAFCSCSLYKNNAFGVKEKNLKNVTEHAAKTRNFCLNELLSFRNYAKLISLNKGLF